MESTCYLRSEISGVDFFLWKFKNKSLTIDFVGTRRMVYYNANKGHLNFQVGRIIFKIAWIGQINSGCYKKYVCSGVHTRFFAPRFTAQFWLDFDEIFDCGWVCGRIKLIRFCGQSVEYKGWDWRDMGIRLNIFENWKTKFWLVILMKLAGLCVTP